MTATVYEDEMSSVVMCLVRAIGDGAVTGWDGDDDGDGDGQRGR